MSADRLLRVKDVFHAALEQGSDVRSGFLDQACAGDPVLRKEVESLLTAHEAAARFLESSHQVMVGLSPASPFRVGTRLGPYQIMALVGAGGMGEVYRARDERLGREVAVKVLPPDFAANAERLSRFEQEARAASALSHPHILTVYDVGRHEGLPYLVTEFLEGETLAERLAHGPVPVRRALEWAAQAARGLTAVHEHGILHRDLKPSNLFVTGDGQLKILDFGLAKLPAEPAGVSSASPTPLRTRSGAVLGTVGYMSPEQVRGEPLDSRSDQFSLGCVLYEMLTGTRPFERPTAAETLAAVLQEEPPSVLERRTGLPAPVAWTVERCLAKDRQDRYAATRDLARDLELILGRLSNVSGPVAEPRRRALGRVASLLPWVVAVGVAVVATVGVRRPGATDRTPKRFVVPLSDVDSLSDGLGRSIAVVPDGSGLAYVGVGGRGGGDPRIHLYTLRDGASHPVPGTERAVAPFVSPDGKWLGFFQDSQLKKVATVGGPPLVICDAPNPGGPGGGGASWGTDDRIVFSRGTDRLWQAPASGGKPRALTTLDAARGEAAHSAPHVLPGGRAVLFTLLSTSGGMEDAAIAVLSVASGERRILVRGGASPKYVASGHLVYVRGTDLLVVPFDPDNLAIVAAPALAVPAVRITPQSLNGQFDAAADGTLVYVPGVDTDLGPSLVWVDRRETVRPLRVPPRRYSHPNLLPADQGVIVEIEDTPHNIWRGDFASGALTRLTHEGANHRPVLSRDGRFMAFSSDRTVPRSLFRQATDGSGLAEQLLKAPYPHNATSWSPDGRWLAFTETHPETKDDIWILPLEGERRPRAFLKTPFDEGSAVFSPDGQWIAYASNESGHREVLVTAFPGPGPRKQVSMNGGDTPVFSRDGRRLFYQRGKHILVTEILTTPTLTSSTPSVAFGAPAPIGQLPNFAVNATGDAILTLKSVARSSGPPEVHVVVNWFEELRRLAPVN